MKFLSPFFALLFLSTCATSPRIPADGRLLDETVQTFVDSEFAKRYLELGNPVENFDPEVRSALERADRLPLDWQTLRDLSASTSPDFATVYFVHRLHSDPRNLEFFSKYKQEYNCILRRSRCSKKSRHDLVRSQYKFLVIGGFHYKSDTSTGADLAKPRAYLKDHGYDVELIETEEDGTIEENAAIVAKWIRSQPSEKKLVLVSASKGSPEVALAIGRLMLPEETRQVRAWVSIGGLLRGSFLADGAMQFPTWWIAKFVLWVQGIDSKSVPGMTTESSRRRFQDLVFPKHIAAIQYIGIPLSGQVSSDVRSRYCDLRQYGPNDGLSLLADELIPGGIALMEIGVDHYFRDPDMPYKALALANLITQGIW